MVTQKYVRTDRATIWPVKGIWLDSKQSRIIFFLRKDISSSVPSNKSNPISLFYCRKWRVKYNLGVRFGSDRKDAISIPLFWSIGTENKPRWRIWFFFSQTAYYIMDTLWSVQRYISLLIKCLQTQIQLEIRDPPLDPLDPPTARSFVIFIREAAVIS